jgi:hypothetical protein
MRIAKQYDFGALAAAVATARLNGPGEAARFEGFLIEEVRSVLDSAVSFAPSVPEADRRNLLWGALVQAAASPAVTGDAMTLAIKNAEREYLRERPKAFVVATSVSIAHFSALRRVNMDGGMLIFSRRLPRNFERTTINDRIAELTNIDTAGRFTAVRIPVLARTSAGAFEAALNRLDLWRSLWNLSLNRETLLRRSSGARQPVNQVRLGPVHTVHASNGALATERFWYELPHQQSPAVASLENKYASLKNAERRYRRKLKGSGYRPTLESLLIRYVRALDIPDFDVAFNKLWSVFEALGGSIGDYRRLIDRAIFVYASNHHEFTRQVFEHLRDVRNGIVHEDRGSDEMETYLYQLKRVVEDLFRYHLGRGLEFSSIAAATEFLDLPVELSTLRAQIKLRQRALQFRAS